MPLPSSCQDCFNAQLLKAVQGLTETVNVFEKWERFESAYSTRSQITCAPDVFSFLLRPAAFFTTFYSTFHILSCTSPRSIYGSNSSSKPPPLNIHLASISPRLFPCKVLVGNLFHLLLLQCLQMCNMI